MITILILFLVGIFLGWLFRKVKPILKISSALTLLSVMALLFFLGYQAGHNADIQAHLDTIGIKALVIGILSVSGSVVFVMFFNRFTLKK